MTKDFDPDKSFKKKFRTKASTSTKKKNPPFYAETYVGRRNQV